MREAYQTGSDLNNEENGGSSDLPRATSNLSRGLKVGRMGVTPLTEGEIDLGEDANWEGLDDEVICVDGYFLDSDGGDTVFDNSDSPSTHGTFTNVFAPNPATKFLSNSLPNVFNSSSFPMTPFAFRNATTVLLAS